MKESSQIFRKASFIGFITIFLSVVALLVVFAFLLLGRKGEPANLNTATGVTQKFLESIHAGNIKAAHSMLSEKFNPSVTVEQFATLIHQDDNIFQAYDNWKICDWGLFISDGYVIDTSGLLYYDNEKIVVQISLHKDSDSVWRIQGFRFRSDIDPMPFGLCQ
jgi:hypothetical protein